MKIVHEHLALDPRKRVIAIGDIHGGKDLLEKLLLKVRFSADDELFLLGDYTERGPECLETVHLIERLAQKPNVHALQGNNDTVWWFLEDHVPASFKDYIALHPFSIFREMAASAGFSWEEATDDELRAFYRTHGAREFSFLKSLPHIIETSRLLFIHAGIDDLARESSLSAIAVMKNDGFLNKRLVFSKRLVVGHFPTKIYRHFCECANPIFDRTLNTIAIDGGYACSYGGQLNALVLAGEDDPSPSFMAVDDLPSVHALKTHEEPYVPVRTLVYDRDPFAIVEKGPHASLVRRLDDDATVMVPTSLIYEKNHRHYCFDSSPEHLSFAKGDALSIVHSVGADFVMKHHGISGWVAKKDLGLAFPFARKGTMQDASELERLRGRTIALTIPDADPFYEDGLHGRLYVLEGPAGLLGSASVVKGRLTRVAFAPGVDESAIDALSRLIQEEHSTLSLSREEQ